jgi:hypothetical protein
VGRSERSPEFFTNSTVSLKSSCTLSTLALLIAHQRCGPQWPSYAAIPPGSAKIAKAESHGFGQVLAQLIEKILGLGEGQ